VQKARFKAVPTRKVPRAVKDVYRDRMGGYRNGWRHLAHVVGEKSLHFIVRSGAHGSQRWFCAEVSSFTSVRESLEQFSRAHLRRVA
jgi:hypothetical protein